MSVDNSAEHEMLLKPSNYNMQCTDSFQNQKNVCYQKWNTHENMTMWL